MAATAATAARALAEAKLDAEEDAPDDATPAASASADDVSVLGASASSADAEGASSAGATVEEEEKCGVGGGLRLGLDATWFTGVDWSSDADDPHALARTANEALECLRRCHAYLRTASAFECVPEARVVARRCRALWRRAFHEWRTPAGNGLNLPDLLWVVDSALRVVAAPRLTASASATYPARWRTRLEQVQRLLSQGDQSGTGAARLEEWRGLEPELRWLVVAGADAQAATRTAGVRKELQRLQKAQWTETDIAFQTLGVELEGDMDNRVHAKEWKGPSAAETQAAAAALAVAQAAEAAQAWALGELVTLGSRLSFWSDWHRALTTSAPGYAVHPLRIEGGARLEAHVRGLLDFHIDESVLQQAHRLALQRCLSWGAYEQSMRRVPTPWTRVGLTGLVRSDTLRAQPALAELHRVAHTPPELLYQEPRTWGTGPAWREWGESVVEVPRDAWRLALLHNELQSLFYVDFLRDYVVPAHELRERHEVYTRTRRQGKPRLPVLLRAAGYWHVHLPTECWPCASLPVALEWWVQLVHERFGDVTEEDTHLGAWLRPLLPPPAAPPPE